ncbi:MAG: carbonic anhydrase family protein [Polyangiales bacterium]
MAEPTRLLISSVVLLPIALFAAFEHQTRTPETKAPKPYALPGLNHGLLQSPVNIITSQAERGQHEVALNLHHAEPSYLENKGHTIQLDFPRGSSITFDGRDYELEQLHFHTPSEHQIDGITYPMEMHVVNMIEPKSEEEPPRYLVVSFLYKMGAEDPLITGFLAEVPAGEGREEVKGGRVHITAGDGDTDYDYYHYRGSLTTPPYTETVEWLIVKEIREASPEQIRRINLLEGNNARRVQALYGRKVE